MTKSKFKKLLKEMLDEDPTMKFGNNGEEIYIIDDIIVYGSFDYGVRGVDHYSLFFEDTTWENLCRWGTIIIPETQVYISDKTNHKLNSYGYTRYPVNRSSELFMS